MNKKYVERRKIGLLRDAKIRKRKKIIIELFDAGVAVVEKARDGRLGELWWSRQGRKRGQLGIVKYGCECVGRGWMGRLGDGDPWQ